MPAALAHAADTHAQDLDFLCARVADDYAYLEPRELDLDAACRRHRELLLRARSRDESVSIFESFLRELADAHAHLTVNTPSSPLLLPSGSQLWAEWRNDVPVVVDVRPGSAAEREGIRAGSTIVWIDGRPIRDALESWRGAHWRGSSSRRNEWLLNAALTGRRGERRRLELVADGKSRLVEFSSDDVGTRTTGALEHRLVGDRRNIGLIRFHDSLDSAAAVHELDAALEELRPTAGLILDLRDTPSGGNSTVARAILGRFVSDERPYQKHELAGEERRYGVKRSWLELVSPRGPFTYAAPVIVLVSHWTGSMGEGLALGFDAVGRGHVVGTRMAGLRGAVTTLTLPSTGIGVSLPTERLFHVDGTPRERWLPRTMVDPATAPSADPILERAVNLLETRRGRGTWPPRPR